MTDNEQQFEEYIDSFPQVPENLRQEAALRKDELSTPYWKARRNGWTHAELVGDMQTSGRNGGFGLILTRLRRLSESKPLGQKPQPKLSNSIRTSTHDGRVIEPHLFKVEDEPFCGCGLPRANRVHA